MILPQVQAIRDTPDADAACIVVKETQLSALLTTWKNADLVVTDGQVFGLVSNRAAGNFLEFM